MHIIDEIIEKELHWPLKVIFDKLPIQYVITNYLLIMQ